MLNSLNDFRANPKSFIDLKSKLKKKHRAEYESFLGSLNSMPLFEIDPSLNSIAESELSKFIGDSDYEKIQRPYKMTDEGQKKKFEEIALVAIDDVKEKDEIIPKKIISNEGDKEKKGRSILTNEKFTHLGLGLIEEEGDITLVLLFAQKLEAKENKKEPDKIQSEVTTDKENGKDETDRGDRGRTARRSNGDGSSASRHGM